MAETLTANTVNLLTKATRVEDLAGLYGAPARRTKNLLVPGRHGELRVPRKLYGPGALPLKMSVMGVDKTTGVVPGGSSTEKEFQARVDELLAIFAADTITLDHTLPDASVRRIIAELAQSPLLFAPQVAQYRFGQLVVELTAPYPFWTDTAATTATMTGATGAVLSLAGFAGATAPMDQLTITFGPCSNPQLIQGNTSVAYNGVIAAGQELVINTGTWSLSTGTGSAWTPDYSKVSYSPGPQWWFIDPLQALSATFSHTEGGSATVTVVGPRAYLTA